MKKRFSVFLLVILLLTGLFRNNVFACDEQQTETYVTQILFGDKALSKSNDEKVKMLLNALYLCSEQTGKNGEDKLNYLKNKKVSGVSSLSNLSIKSSELMECSHNSWEYVYTPSKGIQESRKKILQTTVNKVFDFGFINNVFANGGEQANSFSALLYYAHILSDYLADDPKETEVNVNGKMVSGYSGQAYITINGGIPNFTKEQKQSTTSFVKYSELDSNGRAGTVIANVGSDTLDVIGVRQNMTNIRPSGWSFNRYDGIVNSQPAYLYNRCHLLAHSLGGIEQEKNLVTGTRYMNEIGMGELENKVTQYIKNTNNHVLYRATPIYKGDNKLVSGVQLEAYSVEDNGQGICFNVYCYNVQPGIDINYVNGDSAVSDTTIGVKKMLPFAVYNASDNNPDLIYEMNKQFEILFKNQLDSKKYNSLKNEITNIAYEARSASIRGDNKAQQYAAMKKCEYKYLEVLKNYVPLLLQEEDFFQSAFN